MLELARVSGIVVLILASSVGVAYALTALSRLSRSTPSPIPNGQLRIRSGASMYRARFLGETREGWTFTAPLQRDAYVPLRVGESLVIEAPSLRGVLRFRTVIIDRLHDSAVMVAERPGRVHVEERRADSRRTDLSCGGVKFEGADADLLDVSASGARLSVPSPVERGERVRVDLGWDPEPRFGWVLDIERLAGKLIVRLRFEESLCLPPLK